MNREIKRKIQLEDYEVKEAVLHWLVNVKDIPVGENATVSMGEYGLCCTVESIETSEIDLTTN